jgi:hypothetical protein
MASVSTERALVRRCLVLALAALAGACGSAGESADDLPLTISECEDLGGTPLFDPDDQRPSELSCPQGLRFMGEFDEAFYGDVGGVCCGDLAPSAGAAEVL